MKPRAGTVVNDYRKEGSLFMLESIFNFRRGNLDPELMRSLLEVRGSWRPKPRGSHPGTATRNR